MNWRSPWILVALVVLFVAVVRIRMMDIPLERDEGEYAYAGQLLLHGVPPYKLAFNMKFPGVYAAYAAAMAVFGQTVVGIHAGFLVANAATIVLIFLLGRRLLSDVAGATAAATYGVLSMEPGVMGMHAHATHFVMLAALGGTLLLVRATEREESGTLFWSGALFGLAVLMKQHAVLFVAFGGLYFLWDQVSRQRPGLLKGLAIFACGVCLPLGLTGFALWRAGVFAKFWFWTVTYAREYVSEQSWARGWEALRIRLWTVTGPNVAIWAVALAGLILIWAKKEDRRRAIFGTGFAAFSFLAMCPGLYFRQHYFVLILPAVALLAGYAVAVAHREWPRGSMQFYSAYACLLAIPIVWQAEYFFRMSAEEASRSIYGDSPFVAAVEIGRYIREHSAKDAQIVVLGSEPEIPFYADRRSVTGHMYMYGLMEPQPYALTMQEELIGDVEASRPAYVIVVKTATSWSRRPNSPMRLFDWWDVYRPLHYKLVGVADIDVELPAEVKWGDVENVRTKSPSVVLVYRRTGP